MLTLPFASFTRTRIAPTPSGYLHKGNLFSFLITHALAKISKAELVLRIDDLDVLRVEDEYVKSIYHILRTFSIEWQIGPSTFEETKHHTQQSRTEIYFKHLHSLQTQQLVYACTCSRAEILKRCGDHGYDGHCRDKNIDLGAPDVCWRIKTDYARPIKFRDEIGNEIKHVLPKSMFDFVVKRRDNIPCYQLASLVDDVFYEIDFIVRGQDLFDSSLAQLYLAELLKFDSFAKVRFLHHPLLVDATGTKLSKTKGSESIHAQLLQGKSAEQIKRELIQQLPQQWQHYFKDGF